MRYGGEKLGLGYHVHYVVDGGKSRVILNALVTPSEVMEQQPMLDLLWRTAFRWRLRPRQVTGEAAYGPQANIASIERAGVRAYVNLKERENPDKRFFPSSAFAYDEERDLFRCPGGQELLPWNSGDARDGRRYKARTKICAACSLKPGCTPNKRGRTVFRHFDEHYVDRVRAYRETQPYHRALRKRKVWVEPLFAEAKAWHGMRRFRLGRLKKVNQEALMIAAGQNVKRLLAACEKGPRRPARVAALRPAQGLPSAGRSVVIAQPGRAFSTGSYTFAGTERLQGVRRRETSRALRLPEHATAHAPRLPLFGACSGGLRPAADS
jgi:hypothetical protein